jgi:hypothetical protein
VTVELVSAGWRITCSREGEASFIHLLTQSQQVNQTKKQESRFRNSRQLK